MVFLQIMPNIKGMFTAVHVYIASNSFSVFTSTELKSIFRYTVGQAVCLSGAWGYLRWDLKSYTDGPNDLNLVAIFKNLVINKQIYSHSRSQNLIRIEESQTNTLFI